MHSSFELNFEFLGQEAYRLFNGFVVIISSSIFSLSSFGNSSSVDMIPIFFNALKKQLFLAITCYSEYSLLMLFQLLHYLQFSTTLLLYLM